MDNAVIYARYSSDKQTEQSIEGQVRVCKQFAKDNNLNVIDIYCDRALSGRTDHRPDFQKMLKDSSKHNFQYVIVYKLDRFARNRYDSAINKATLRKNGVKLLSAVENITDSPEGIILESMLEGMAEYYSVELAQKVKRGQYESLQKHNFLGGYVPFGYIIKDKKYAIDETKAELVNSIFTDFAKGKRVKDIVAELKAKNIKNNTGKDFTVNTLMYILKNKKYIGILEYGGEEIENYLPSIVTKEIFDAVNNRIKRNSRTPGKYKAKTEYLLSGKLYCGHCMSLMTGETGTSRSGQVYNYYKCFGKKKHNKCNKHNVPKLQIENLVVKLTLEHILKQDIRETIIKGILDAQNIDTEQSTLQTLYEQKKVIGKQIENCINAIKKGITSDALQNELTTLEQQSLELEISITKQEKIENNKLTEKQIRFWLSQFDNVDINDEKVKAQIINTFVNKVILFDNKLTIIFNNSENNYIDSKLNIDELWSKCSYLSQFGEPNTPLPL